MSKAMSNEPYRIVRLAGRDHTPELLARIDHIFFDASGREFHSARERAAFRQRWLGRYLREVSDIVLLAVADDAEVAGYLVGSIEDPAEQQRFSDIGYLRTHFRALCRRFPAHLHVNLASPFRNQGIGARLVETFAALASEAGAPGMHVVTARAARNVRFYERCRFSALGVARAGESDIVFLARALRARA
jgi:GNAT superfamily N-acetyltransferase